MKPKVLFPVLFLKLCCLGGRVGWEAGRGEERWPAFSLIPLISFHPPPAPTCTPTSSDSVPEYCLCQLVGVKLCCGKIHIHVGFLKSILSGQGPWVKNDFGEPLRMSQDVVNWGRQSQQIPRFQTQVGLQGDPSEQRPLCCC